MKIKSPLKKFRLSHIAWFFSGVVIIGAAFLLFKNYKSITADWISASASMLTFLLASWSAFKVNKWLNSKVNDSAFKQTEKILESISKIHLSSRFILDDCKLFSESDLIDAIYYSKPIVRESANKTLHDKLKSIEKHTQICSEMNLQLQILTYELPMWNIGLKNQKIKTNILNIIASTNALIENCNKLKEKTNQQNLHYAITISKEIIECFHPILVENINNIVTKQYEEIFKPITSSSKNAN